MGVAVTVAVQCPEHVFSLQHGGEGFQMLIAILGFALVLSVADEPLQHLPIDCVVTDNLSDITEEFHPSYSLGHHGLAQLFDMVNELIMKNFSKGAATSQPLAIAVQIHPLVVAVGRRLLLVDPDD
jgi:hypothetical protein